MKLVPGGKSGLAYQIEPGRSCVQVGKFTADPAKNYRIELDLKALEKPCANFGVSIRYTDSKRSVVDAKPVAVLPETRTVLAKPAEAGAKTVELQDASKWTRGYSAAFGVKEDDSDLPRAGLNSVVGIKGNVVTLAAPLPAALPAGACVVQHRPGFYFRLKAGTVGQEWEHWTIEVPGKSLTPVAGWQYELVLECPKAGSIVLADNIVIQDASAPAVKIEESAPVPAVKTGEPATKDEVVPAFSGRLTARTDFDISPVWVPKKFMDKDFRMILPVGRYTPSPDPVARAEGALKYSLDAELVGGGEVVVTGSAEVPVALLCGRCARFFSTNAKKSAFLRAYAWDDHPETLDLTDDIREELLLELPGYPLCRPDCKGLCPQCGRDLNEGDCGCAPPEESADAGPWAALDGWNETDAGNGGRK